MTKNLPEDKGSLILKIKGAEGLPDGSNPFLVISIGRIKKKTKVQNDESDPDWNEYIFFQELDFKKIEEVCIECFDKSDEGPEYDGRIGVVSFKPSDFFQEKINHLELDFTPKDRGTITFEAIPIYTHKKMLFLYKNSFFNDFKDEDVEFIFKRSKFDDSDKTLVKIDGTGKYDWKVNEGLEIEYDEDKYLCLDWSLDFYFDSNGVVKGLSTREQVFEHGIVKIPHTYISFGVKKDKNIDIIVIHFKKDIYQGTYRITGDFFRKNTRFSGVWKILHMLRRSTFLEDYAEVSGKCVFT